MSETLQWVMGVDGGGTKTHAWLAEIQPDGTIKVLGKGLGEASNYSTLGAELAQAAIQAAMRDAFSQAKLAVRKLDGLCLGLAGVDRPEDQRWAEQWAAGEAFSEKLVVVNDGYLPLWAGTPQGWGLGLIAGTGSICLGRSPEGKVVRTGGWGWIIGDEGSACSMGIAALRAVSQAADGRAKPTLLTRLLLDYYSETSADGLISKVYQTEVTPQKIAALAPLVGAAAEEGDETASAIRAEAAAALGKLLATTYQRLGLTVEAPCALGGGVLTHDSTLVGQTLTEARRLGVKVGAVEIVTEPVVGAVKLAAAEVLPAGQMGVIEPA
jgi:N-acetylmuramic acid 6-phosphate etherase